MNTYYLKRARELWNSGYRNLDRHNQRAWVRSLKMLGPKWLLLKKVEKTCAAQSGS